jgi:hypothetical protein
MIMGATPPLEENHLNLKVLHKVLQVLLYESSRCCAARAEARDAALPACQLEAGKEQCSLCSVAGRRAECRHRS